MKTVIFLLLCVVTVSTALTCWDNNGGSGSFEQVIHSFLPLLNSHI